MIIENIEQGTEEWHELRKGVVTASRFKDVLSQGRGSSPSKTRQSYMYELAAEILTGQVEFTEPNKYMAWGNEQEPMAREMYEFMTDNEVRQVAFIKHDSLNCGASPDGLVGDNGGIEIKCPKTTTQIETFLSGKMPSIHKAQVQGCLWLSEREFWDFISYDPRINGQSSFFKVRVERDEDYIKNLEQEIILFNDQLQDLINQLR